MNNFYSTFDKAMKAMQSLAETVEREGIMNPIFTVLPPRKKDDDGNFWEHGVAVRGEKNGKVVMAGASWDMKKMTGGFWAQDAKDFLKEPTEQD